MIVEYIRYKIPPQMAVAFESDYAQAAAGLDSSEHCLAYELTSSIEDPASYVLRIEWDSAEGHMQGFRNSESFRSFLIPIKPYLDHIAEMRHYRQTAVKRIKMAMSGEISPTLYEWVGGQPALERLTSVFYERVAQDSLIGPLFARMDADHARTVALFIAEVFGGPATYSQERGGHHAMIMKHVGRHLTEAQRSRWMGLLLQCADEVGLPNDPEFRAAFVAYIEWGTRLAVANSQVDKVPDVSAAMPKWGWGETHGPYRS